MYMAGRLRTPSRPFRTWMFRASYECPPSWAVVRVPPSSRVWFKCAFLPAPHRREPDGPEPGFDRKPCVDVVHDLLPQHREVPHPHRAPHFHEELSIPHPHRAGAPLHLRRHLLVPQLGRLRRSEALLEPESAQHPREHRRDRFESALARPGHEPTSSAATSRARSAIAICRNRSGYAVRGRQAVTITWLRSGTSSSTGPIQRSSSSDSGSSRKTTGGSSSLASITRASASRRRIE